MRNILIAAALVLAGCSSTPDIRVATPETAAPERVRVSYGSVVVREVSLPTHAAGEEIALAGPAGEIGAAGALWADDPVRAVTLDLTRALSQITGARVAPDPWPFQSYPDAAVDVRLTYLLPEADGTYRARGMAFVAPAEGAGRDRAVAVDLSAPFDPAGGALAIAAARGALIAQLADLIARKGMR